MSEQDWAISERDIFATMAELLASNRKAAVATIVGVEGSAYRRPGAKMIIEEGGTSRGHITAGCLEGEVIELVDEVLAADEPRIETYDLMEDDDVWGLGVGCNGIIDVLVEPLDETYAPLLETLAAGEPVGVITVLDGVDADGAAIPLASRAYYRAGSVAGDVPEWVSTAAAERAATLVERGRADIVTLDSSDGEATVFIDGIQPAPRLVVLGSGHDVGPVVELGKKNGFSVEVVGFRGAVDLVARFPNADEHHSTSPTDLVDDLGPDANTFVFVMTHNFVDDRIALERLVETDVPYIGLMGPRERFEEMLEDFADEGRSFAPEELARIYTPVGLDLGAGSPYGIATSMVSEALAVHNDRHPGHLKEREGPIHDRVSIEAGTVD